MKRGRSPCERQNRSWGEYWGRGFHSPPHRTPYFLMSSFCLSLSPSSFLSVHHFSFPPEPLLSPPLTSLCLLLSLSFLSPLLLSVCSPSWLPLPPSLILNSLSSMYPFSVQAPSLSFSICLLTLSFYLFYFLPHLFLNSISLSFMYLSLI